MKRLHITVRPGPFKEKRKEREENVMGLLKDKSP